MRETVLFCDGWEFSMQPIGTEYRSDFEWMPVDIPHDWLIEDTNDLYKTSTGWYRRRLTVPADGRRTSLRFEGVYMDSRVYVNGRLAGEWKYGYTTFEFDLTDLLCEGENEITVRVDHRAPNSRWYSGAGIYRRVWLNRFENTHILPDGIYISADVDGTVTVTTEAERPGDTACAGLTVKAAVYRASDSERSDVLAGNTAKLCAADCSALVPEVVREGFKYSVNTQILKVNNPKLWDIGSPTLYLCEVELYCGEELLDRKEVRFGFRSIEFTTDRGFFLNGRHVKLHGACMHHDLGALGAAVNRYAIKRQLLILRDMGVNSIRTSHNPPAVELLELADEMGLLILDEGFDMWERPKTEFDYARFFDEWINRDVASWVRRDRNHPCIIGWSIGNEIYDTHADERGQEVTSLLKALVEKNDPRGNGYVTIGSNFMGGEGARRCADILKVAGYNYSERLYDKQHADHPDWMMYGSETSSVVQSRGIYHFPLERAILCDDDEQCSSLGNSSPVWAAKNWEACIIPDRDRDYIAGQYIWTGFDYIGEPTPYSTKNSYFGQIDTAGFPKDSSFVFRTVWTDYKTAPFIHIFPYWDFKEGDIIDVRVATNCPNFSVRFNGELIAQRSFDPAHDTALTYDFKLPYKEGVIRADGYDEKGMPVVVAQAKSFGDTARFNLTSDRKALRAGSDMLAFVEISAVDNNGVTVANANDRVTVNVTGAGRLVGLDNGDSTDYEQYKGISRRLFSGKLLAIIAPTAEAGDIKITVTSPSAQTAELVIKSVESEPVQGMSFLAHNTERPCCADVDTDIPVRRIALTGERTGFDQEHKELRFSPLLCPASNTYKDSIEYRVTTAEGITSPLAQIVTSDAEGVTVRCLGDGEMYLRAACRNGTDKIHVFGMLRLTADGIGSALTDPYQLVMGGLYTLSGGNVSTGIYHGAGIGQGGGWIGFENVDLGMAGSDEITVPLFANYSTPVRMKIWDGTPDSGELLGDFEYALEPKWLTYQPMTYKLPKTLRGIHTISIQSDLAYDVQGFRFTERPKETAEITAAAALNIYGDSFTMEAEAVTGIGNNVTLDFGSFDFGENVPSRIVITGRSALPVNSIHLQSEGSETRRYLLEFEGCSDYTERSFPLDGLESRTKISFFFLPGCDFDMKSFRFE
ncbi:MAG: DUF4982 domain-containing protein [Ruminococcus sp.]|nr:DUF4982 domain-containing protein [Ruminococcus sp.]